MLAIETFKEDYPPPGEPRPQGFYEQRDQHQRRMEAAIDVLSGKAWRLVYRDSRSGHHYTAVFASTTPTRATSNPVQSLEVDGVEIRITELGLRFLVACTAPKREGESP